MHAAHRVLLQTTKSDVSRPSEIFSDPVALDRRARALRIHGALAAGTLGVFVILVRAGLCRSGSGGDVRLPVQDAGRPLQDNRVLLSTMEVR